MIRETWRPLEGAKELDLFANLVLLSGRPGRCTYMTRLPREQLRQKGKQCQNSPLNHSDMVKFTSVEENRLKKLLEELVR